MSKSKNVIFGSLWPFFCVVRHTKKKGYILLVFMVARTGHVGQLSSERLHHVHEPVSHVTVILKLNFFVVFSTILNFILKVIYTFVDKITWFSYFL